MVAADDAASVFGRDRMRCPAASCFFCSSVRMGVGEAVTTAVCSVRREHPASRNREAIKRLRASLFIRNRVGYESVTGATRLARLRWPELAASARSPGAPPAERPRQPAFSQGAQLRRVFLPPSFRAELGKPPRQERDRSTASNSWSTSKRRRAGQEQFFS